MISAVRFIEASACRNRNESDTLKPSLEALAPNGLWANDFWARFSCAPQKDNCNNRPVVRCYSLETGVVFRGALSKPCLHGSPTRGRATCASWRGAFHWRTGSAQSLLRLSERRDLRPSEGRLLCVRVSHTFPAPIQVFLAIPNHVSKPVCIAPGPWRAVSQGGSNPRAWGCKAKCSCRRARKALRHRERGVASSQG